MIPLRFCLFLIFGIVLQGAGSKYIRTLKYLDLALIITVYYAVKGNKIYSTIIGSIIGLMQDAITSIPLGINGFSKSLVGYVVAVISKKMVIEGHPIQLVVLFLSSLLNTLLVLSVFNLIEWKSFPQLRQVVILAAATSIVGTFILNFLNRKPAPELRRQG